MRNIFPVLFLGIVNTGIGCCLYFSAIKELSAGSVAICGYLEPLSALLFSALLLSERLSFIQIIGAICIIGGAIFAESYKYIIANIVKISTGSVSAEEVLNEALKLNSERAN